MKNKNLTRYIFATFTTVALTTTLCRYAIKGGLALELAALLLVVLNTFSLWIFKKIFHDDFVITLKHGYPVTGVLTLITMLQLPIIMRTARVLTVRGEMIFFYLAFLMTLALMIIALLAKKRR